MAAVPCISPSRDLVSSPLFFATDFIAGVVDYLQEQVVNYRLKLFRFIAKTILLAEGTASSNATFEQINAHAHCAC